MVNIAVDAARERALLRGRGFGARPKIQGKYPIGRPGRGAHGGFEVLEKLLALE